MILKLLLPLISKESESWRTEHHEEAAIFKLYSLGIVTNRDEWAYDDDRIRPAKKIRFFCDAYER